METITYDIIIYYIEKNRFCFSETVHCAQLNTLIIKICNSYDIISNGIIQLFNYCMIIYDYYNTYFNVGWLAQSIASHLCYSYSIVNVGKLAVICRQSNQHWNIKTCVIITNIIIYYLETSGSNPTHDEEKLNNFLGKFYNNSDKIFLDTQYLCKLLISLFA